MKLFLHQRKIVDEDPKKCGLFLGTGSGKTLVALLLARGKTLVICPKTQRQDRNWEREIEKNERHIDIGVKLTVMSKEEFKKVASNLLAFDTVIVDEAHTCLGVMPNTRWRKKVEIPKASQIFEALDGYLQRTKPARLYLCTATIVKSPFTVWAAGKLLGKHWDFYNFRNKFYIHLPMPGRTVFVPKHDKIIKEELGVLVRSLGHTGQISDYVDLPEQNFKTDYLELTAKQSKRIKEIPLEFPDPLVASLKKHMIENGMLSGDEFSEGEVFENQKVDKILEYASEFPRMVVFARYRAQIEQIAAALRSEGKNVYTLTGDTKDRGSMILEAKNSEEYVFICQSQVSAGWELPECPVVIFASLDFSIVNYIQSIGRISRINNPKSNLYIHLVVKNSIDDHVHKTVVGTKMDFHLAQFV